MKLKPCPFCGSDATVHANHNFKDDIWFVYVQCEMCGARGKTRANRNYFNPDDDGFWESNSVYSVVRAWNKRV